MIAAVRMSVLNEPHASVCMERLKLYGYQIRAFMDDEYLRTCYTLIFDNRCPTWAGWRVAMVAVDEKHRPDYQEWVKNR
jgi:hypothetical protein